MPMSIFSISWTTRGMGMGMAEGKHIPAPDLHGDSELVLCNSWWLMEGTLCFYLGTDETMKCFPFSTQMSDTVMKSAPLDRERNSHTLVQPLVNLYMDLRDVIITIVFLVLGLCCRWGCCYCCFQKGDTIYLLGSDAAWGNVAFTLFFSFQGRRSDCERSRDVCFKTHSWLVAEPGSPHWYLRKNSNSIFCCSWNRTGVGDEKLMSR